MKIKNIIENETKGVLSPGVVEAIVKKISKHYGVKPEITKYDKYFDFCEMFLKKNKVYTPDELLAAFTQYFKIDFTKNSCARIVRSYAQNKNLHYVSRSTNGQRFTILHDKPIYF